MPAEYPTQKQPPPPPPIITDEGEEYVVEEIMDSKLSRGKLKYLVKWEGYPNHTNWTWEPKESILPDNQAEFHNKHPSAPRHIDIRGMNFRPMPEALTDHGEVKNNWLNGKLSIQPMIEDDQSEEGVML
jgi:Chromo (CHRromatin Organisation MOdifier) domain